MNEINRFRVRLLVISLLCFSNILFFSFFENKENAIIIEISTFLVYSLIDFSINKQFNEFHILRAVFSVNSSITYYTYYDNNEINKYLYFGLLLTLFFWSFYPFFKKTPPQT